MAFQYASETWPEMPLISLSTGFSLCKTSFHLIKLFFKVPNVLNCLVLEPQDVTHLLFQTLPFYVTFKLFINTSLLQPLPAGHLHMSEFNEAQTQVMSP